MYLPARSDRVAELHELVASSAVKELCATQDEGELEELARMLDVEAAQRRLIGEFIILSGELIRPSEEHIQEVAVGFSIFEGRFNGFEVVTDQDSKLHIAYNAIKRNPIQFGGPYLFGGIMQGATGNVFKSSFQLVKPDIDLITLAEDMESDGIDLDEIDGIVFDDDISVEETLRNIQAYIDENNYTADSVTKILEYIHAALFAGQGNMVQIKASTVLIIEDGEITELFESDAGNMILATDIRDVYSFALPESEYSEGGLTCCMTLIGKSAGTPLYVPFNRISSITSVNE